MVSSFLDRQNLRQHLSDRDWTSSNSKVPSVPGSLYEQQMRRQPKWVRPTLDALQELLRLSQNWNSYGARPVDPNLALTALNLLLDAAGPNDIPPPQVVPTNHGGVQLEWHTGGIYLEVEVRPAGRYYLSFEDAPRNARWEGEYGSAIGPLSDAIDELRRHT